MDFLSKLPPNNRNITPLRQTAAQGIDSNRVGTAESAESKESG